MTKINTHFIIPDTQVKPGVDIRFLRWVGRYMVDHLADHPEWNTTIVHLGDHWDMPSLSWYDRGKKAAEGQRVEADVEAGDDGFALLNEALEVHNSSRSARGKWRPRKLWLPGNHEDRLTRHAETYPWLEGTLGLDRLNTLDWERAEYLKPSFIDGIAYAHYFYDPQSGRPYGGKSIDTRLAKVGQSFTMGHQQGLLYGLRPVVSGIQHGLVAGSCYLHEEVYKGPQGNTHWRGIIVKHQVEGGQYDPMFVGLDYLCRRYEHKTLAAYLRNTAR